MAPVLQAAQERQAPRSTISCSETSTASRSLTRSIARSRPGVAERLETPAALADDVVVVLGRAADRLVARGALTDLHARKQPDLLELLHHAVDARARSLAPAPLQALLDLGRRERAAAARRAAR